MLPKPVKGIGQVSASCMIAGGSRKPARDVSQHAVFRVVKLTCMRFSHRSILCAPFMCRKHVIPRYSLGLTSAHWLPLQAYPLTKASRAVWKASCDYFAANLELCKSCGQTLPSRRHERERYRDLRDLIVHTGNHTSDQKARAQAGMLS